MTQECVIILVASSIIALAFRNRTIDLVTVALGCYTLTRVALVGVKGPSEDAFVFGMAFSGIFVKSCNYMFFIEPKKLKRRSARDVPPPANDRVRKLVGQSSAALLVSKILQMCSRLWDAFELVVISRGIGWEFELRGLFQHLRPPRSRLGFAVEQIWGAVWRFVLMDLTRQILLTTHLAGLYPLSGPMDYNFWTKIALGALLWQWVRWKMELPYRVAAAVGVLVGWGEPSEWPPIFNSWRNAWTVRRFWSHAWHQNLRLQSEPPVAWFIDDVLKAKKGSLLSRYGRAIGMFFVAFVIHAYARILTGGSASVDLFIFMTQPIIIAFEDVVKNLVSRFRLVTPGGLFSRYLGYLWVFVIQTWLMPFWMDDLVRKGLFREPVFGISLIGHIVELLEAGKGA